MITHALAGRLAAAGLDRIEHAAKAQLFELVLTAFRGRAGGDPAVACWVPGRLEVFGTHTDYAGGRTAVAALPKGFVFAARAARGATLSVTDAASGESLAIDVDGPDSATPSPHSDRRSAYGWRRYILTVLGRLRRNFPDAGLGAEVVFASDLPAAAGMSSSSALIVGLATVLVRLSGIRTSERWQASIAGPLDEAGYYACIENGQTFGALAGDAGVGTHGGSEDHAAIVCGTAGAVTEYAFIPMRRIDVAPLPDDWDFVVAASGIAAEKTGAAMTAYNRLSAGARVLLDLWTASEPAATSLAAALASDPAAAPRLHRLAKTTTVRGWTAEALEARLRHFVQEDARVPQAMLALRASDADAVRELALASQREAESLLGNQIGETSALARLALDHGALASRSFGAGFGGSVWALVPRERARTFAGEWLDAYRSRYSQPRATAFAARPGPPLLELTLDD